MKKRTMDLILIIIGISIFVFTGLMIWIYLLTGGIPDTLCNCFFIACTGECGFMGWIKTAKTKAREREETLFDRAQAKEEQRQALSAQEIINEFKGVR